MLSEVRLMSWCIYIFVVFHLMEMCKSQLTSSVNDNQSFYQDAIFRPVFSNIKNGNRHVYHYNFNESILFKWPAYQLQFYAESEPLKNPTTDTNYPLLVTAHWHGCVRSWEIPINYINDSKALGIANRYSDNIVGKIFWHFPEKYVDKVWNLTVEVSVFNEVTVYYKMKVVILKNFDVVSKQSVKGWTTPSLPAIHRIGPEVLKRNAYMFFDAKSASDICTLLSIQVPNGPFLDVIEGPLNVLTETFTRKTGLSIRSKDFPEGFLVVFLPFAKDAKCKKEMYFGRQPIPHEAYPFRKKLITFQIDEGINPIQFFIPLFVPLIVFVGCAIFSIFMLWKFQRIRYQVLSKANGDVHTIVRDTGIFTSNMTIQNLIITSPSRLMNQSRRYCRAGVVSSAFYCVPVFQLILSFSRRLNETGDYDMCYFNHYCAHMMGRFSDFNHMYSNIGYVLFGMLYLCLVRIRQVTHVTNYCKDRDDQALSTFRVFFPKTDGRLDRGVFTHYGLLYCMGFGVIMTGVMSAGYHVCPNQSNFQFDTVFMYTIAAITFVTIYQFRHPTYLSANFTFTALALVTCVTVLGLLWEQFFIRILFSVGHMLFLLLSLPKVWYTGYVMRNGQLVAHWHEMMGIIYSKFKDDWNNRCLTRFQQNPWQSPDNPEVVVVPGKGRAVLPILLLFANCLALVTMWTALRNDNFATQVMFTCVFNGSFYIVFYSLLKLYHGECRRILWIQPCFYLLMSFVLWGYAVQYFLVESSTWEDSPAESRAKNTACISLGFYDSHDMWHFLSAAGLFCSCMVLLTFDDDLIDQPKSTIPVF